MPGKPHVRIGFGKLSNFPTFQNFGCQEAGRLTLHTGSAKFLSFRKSKNQSLNIEKYSLILCFGHSGVPKTALVHTIKLNFWRKVEQECKNFRK